MLSSFLNCKSYNHQLTFYFISKITIYIIPIQARKSGVKGFFCGVGLGLIGAAVKPVLGITDGLTSVARYVSQFICFIM